MSIQRVAQQSKANNKPAAKDQDDAPAKIARKLTATVTTLDKIGSKKPKNKKPVPMSDMPEAKAKKPKARDKEMEAEIKAEAKAVKREKKAEKKAEAKRESTKPAKKEVKMTNATENNVARRDAKKFLRAIGIKSDNALCKINVDRATTRSIGAPVFTLADADMETLVANVQAKLEDAKQSTFKFTDNGTKVVAHNFVIPKKGTVTIYQTGDDASGYVFLTQNSKSADMKTFTREQYAQIGA